MALTSTLYQFDVRLSHVDRGVNQDLAVKVARHPSETTERLWLRFLAFCWQWEETITFGPGLGDPDEPDLMALGADGSTRTLIVRVGRPTLSRVEKDCAHSGGARVAVLFESGRHLDAFLSEARSGRPERVALAEIAAAPDEVMKVLARRGDRRVKLGLTIVDDHLYLDVEGETVDGVLIRGRP
jgi:uncharacterized protein YaeQ